MLFSMDTNGMKMAIVIVWLILSFVVLLILISPFILSQNTLFMLSRLCELNHIPHIESPLYGMTRAFIFISKGTLSAALKLNSFSIALYVIFVANELFVITLLLTERIKIKRR